YEMIWKRAIASQMTPARFDTVAVDFNVGAAGNTFRATGQTMVFPGFFAVYHEDQDDAVEEEEKRLPAFEKNDAVKIERLYGEQHFTQPPPRYSEASLVKALEQYGIGRPSTYASIISTLQNREYVVLDKKRFTPTDVGRVVNKFLTEHFAHWVDYEYTARLEDELDDISNGKEPLAIRLGRRGRFIGCAGYPECDYTRNMDGAEGSEPVKREIGTDPKTN